MRIPPFGNVEINHRLTCVCDVIHFGMHILNILLSPGDSAYLGVTHSQDYLICM